MDCIAIFSSKKGNNTQLLTSTIGPIELWAFSTTTEDALLRNKLYNTLGPKEARRVLATVFPTGSVKSIVEDKLEQMKSEEGLIRDVEDVSIIDRLLSALLKAYQDNPQFKRLPEW